MSKLCISIDSDNRKNKTTICGSDEINMEIHVGSSSVNSHIMEFIDIFRVDNGDNTWDYTIEFGGIIIKKVRYYKSANTIKEI